MKKENQLSGIVLDLAIEIHRELGPGLLESIYEEVLYKEITALGLDVAQQVPIKAFWRGESLGIGYRADLVVENTLLIEVKSIEHVMPVHKKQILTYLKLTEKKLGLLINFNENLLKDGYHRLVNNL